MRWSLLTAGYFLALICMIAMSGATTAQTVAFERVWPGLKFMILGSATGQPVGHYEYCKKRPSDCQALPAVPPELLTIERWYDLVLINRLMNTNIEHAGDQELYNRDELWTFPSGNFPQGDCEDYVLVKQAALIELGWHPANLLITVVITPDGEGHAVLTAVTRQGEFILDSRSDRITIWSDTHYSYLKRQSRKHSGQWVALVDSYPVHAEANLPELRK